jgi:hypothetical protein
MNKLIISFLSVIFKLPIKLTHARIFSDIVFPISITPLSSVPNLMYFSISFVTDGWLELSFPFDRMHLRHLFFEIKAETNDQFGS